MNIARSLSMCALACGFLVAGCNAPVGEDAGLDAGDLDGRVPLRGLGERCARTEDCSSGLCLDVGDHAVCTQACTDAADCPSGGWDCITPEGLDGRVCGCAAEVDAEICGNGLDDDCNGRPDDCRLCGGVPVPEDDPENCGACGNRCSADEECSGGECRCRAGAARCGALCQDLLSDPDNCGSCGNPCGAGARCANGTCDCTSIATPDYCDGAGCVDLQRDLAHCGGCDNACGTGTVCSAGECACTGTDEELCGGACTNTLFDPMNCGGCDRPCVEGQFCNYGVCQCRDEGIECDGRCVDVRSDRANCGSCGNVCRSDFVCGGGTCSCEGGLGVVCDGLCRPYDDRTNCGACGVTCGPGQYCAGVGSGCICTSSSEMACGATCVLPLTDTNNCGACGVTCRPGEPCTDGVCRCPYPSTYCGAGCANLMEDEANCGACGNRCAAGATCSFGSCYCQWPTPDLCGDTCVRLDEVANCGRCGNVCPTGTSCPRGFCECPFTNEAYCPDEGGCIDVRNNDAHCGSCDYVCPADANCVNGGCQCDTAGETVCGAACVDLQTEEANCGGCGWSCVGAQVCNAGLCTCELPIAGSEVRLTTAVDVSERLGVAASDDAALVVWADRRSGTSAIWSQRLSASGAALGPAMQLSTAPLGYEADQPAVVWTGAEWGVLWEQTSPSFGSRDLWLARMAPDGTLVGAPTAVVSSAGASSQNVALYTPSLGYVVVRRTSFTVVLTTLGATGTSPGLPLTLMPITFTGIDSLGAAAAPTGEIGILWAQSALYFQLVNADGSVTTARSTVTLSSGTSAYEPTLAHDGTSWLASWRELQGATSRIVVGRGGSLATRSTLVSRSDPSPNVRRARLTLRGLEAIVSWQTRASSSSTVWSIDARRVSVPATGAPVGLDASPVPYVATTSVADQPHGVVMFDAGAVVVWSDVRWGDTEIYARGLTLPACAP